MKHFAQYYAEQADSPTAILQKMIAGLLSIDAQLKSALQLINQQPQMASEHLQKMEQNLQILSKMSVQVRDSIYRQN